MPGGTAESTREAALATLTRAETFMVDHVAVANCDDGHTPGATRLE